MLILLPCLAGSPSADHRQILLEVLMAAFIFPRHLALGWHLLACAPSTLAGKTPSYHCAAPDDVLVVVFLRGSFDGLKITSSSSSSLLLLLREQRQCHHHSHYTCELRNHPKRTLRLCMYLQVQKARWPSSSSGPESISSNGAKVPSSTLLPRCIHAADLRGVVGVAIKGPKRYALAQSAPHVCLIACSGLLKQALFDV
jgi:hypothetical protein